MGVVCCIAVGLIMPTPICFEMLTCGDMCACRIGQDLSSDHYSQSAQLKASINVSIRNAEMDVLRTWD